MFALSIPLIANCNDSLNTSNKKIEENLPCKNSTDLTQFKGCLRDLSTKYENLLSSTSDEVSKLLKMAEEAKQGSGENLSNNFMNSQYAWNEYKKRNCEYYASLQGDESSEGIAFSACEIRMETDRLNELNSLKEFFKEQYQKANIDSPEWTESA